PRSQRQTRGEQPAALRFGHRDGPLAEQPEDDLLDGLPGLRVGELPEALSQACTQALRRVLRAVAVADVGDQLAASQAGGDLELSQGNATVLDLAQRFGELGLRDS